MARARVRTIALAGSDGYLLEINAQVVVDAEAATGTVPADYSTGDVVDTRAVSSVARLPEQAICEAKDRVRAAIVNSGLPWPHEAITVVVTASRSAAAAPEPEAAVVSAAPSKSATTASANALAAWRAAGSATDLALACAVLAATDAITPGCLDGTVLLGELSLDGRLHPIPRAHAALLAGRRTGTRRAIIPAAVMDDVALLAGIEVHGAETLVQALAVLCCHDPQRRNRG